jgi:hypothetical protein
MVVVFMGKPIKIGQAVHVLSLSRGGEVVDVRGDRAVVRLASFKADGSDLSIVVPLDDVRRADRRRRAALVAVDRRRGERRRRRLKN